MAVQFRDYYEILGVDKSASQDEIKRAFKKLARKHHPDVAKDQADAEDRFKEINEAYEVLGDDEKRKKYDTLGPNWQSDPGMGGYGGFPGGSDGGQYEYHFDGSTGFSDFFESMFGGGGGGRRGGGDPFGAYGGGGPRRSSRPMAGQDIEADILVRIEEIMTGASREIRLGRPTRNGPQKNSTIRVKIPKGVSGGQSIRCTGMGYPGSNGGPDGDLFLRVRVERHPDYKASGHDLDSELILAPWEAVLGTSLTIPTPHGDVKLTVKPNTQAGTRMRLGGKGLPKGKSGFGDLFLTIVVALPEEADDAEKKLWSELGEKSGFRPRD